MKLPLYLLICATLGVILTDCGVPGIPRPPSLDLPQPVSDLRAVRKGDKVSLAWTVPSETTDGVSMRKLGITKICRNPEEKSHDCMNPVGTLGTPQAPQEVKPKKSANEKIPANYTDRVVPALLSNDPAAEFIYAISVLNQNGRSAGLSNRVAVPAVVALPPPSDFRATLTAMGIVLSWSGVSQTADTPKLRHLYRVYRRELGANNDAVVGQLAFTTSDSYSLVDHSFEWEKSYDYRATVVQVIQVDAKPEEQFEGDDTAPVRVFAHDTFPPGTPGGLQAVSSAPGQQPFIDLIWTPDTDVDLAGYNIYRRGEGASVEKINSELIKTPALRDSNVLRGHRYFYSVSAVDVRGNESDHSAEASETVH
jgi:hypothetical protein